MTDRSASGPLYEPRCPRLRTSPPRYSFVTIQDGLFFSYLLSRQTEAGVSYYDQKSVPPGNACSRC
jgi:hypothetical protein